MIHQPLRLTIDRNALASNWRWLANQAGVRTGAAVKADGYGTGGEAAVETLAAAGCRDFFVSTWWEAEQLGPLAHSLSLAVLHGLGPDDPVGPARPVLNSAEQVARWKERGVGRTCDVMIDTGMNRLGLRPDEVDCLAGLEIDTLHSHLACADADHSLNGQQLQRFREVREAVPARHYSLANSAGICLGRDYSFDLVRPGLALYGGIPRAEARDHIRQVAHLEAQVVQRRTIRAGESCGYGASFVAVQDVEAAIINIGYADGYWVGFSRKGSGSKGEARLPLLGRVSMDLIALDCTGTGVKEGDWIAIDFALEEASQLSGMSQYELLTGLGSRFERRWI